MTKKVPISHKFVEFIPAERVPNTLYISIEYGTAVHDCFCGCGSKIVTPISPTGWKLVYDGDTVSLAPSVGSWGLPCRSHYVIVRDTAVWACNMSQREIERGRQRDQLLRKAYFGSSEVASNHVEIQPKDEDALSKSHGPRHQPWRGGK